MTTAVDIGAGALAAIGFSFLARSAGRCREPFFFALGLAGAALVYLVFTLVRGGWRSVVVEATGFALFSALATSGLRQSSLLLALGWLLHGVWGLALHGLWSAGVTPYGYRWVCVGFDLVATGYILGRFSGRSS